MLLFVYFLGIFNARDDGGDVVSHPTKFEAFSSDPLIDSLILER